MCTWFPVLDKFCFRFELRSGLYAIAALRTFLWFVFMIVAVANYASKVRAVEEKVPFEEILASNVTIEEEASDESGGMHGVSTENVDKGNAEMKSHLCIALCTMHYVLHFLSNRGQRIRRR